MSKFSNYCQYDHTYACPSTDDGEASQSHIFGEINDEIKIEQCELNLNRGLNNLQTEVLFPRDVPMHGTINPQEYTVKMEHIEEFNMKTNSEIMQQMEIEILENPLSIESESDNSIDIISDKCVKNMSNNKRKELVIVLDNCCSDIFQKDSTNSSSTVSVTNRNRYINHKSELNSELLNLMLNNMIKETEQTSPVKNAIAAKNPSESTDKAIPSSPLFSEMPSQNEIVKDKGTLTTLKVKEEMDIESNILNENLISLDNHNTNSSRINFDGSSLIDTYNFVPLYSNSMQDQTVEDIGLSDVKVKEEIKIDLLIGDLISSDFYQISSPRSIVDKSCSYEDVFSQAQIVEDISLSDVNVEDKIKKNIISHRDLKSPGSQQISSLKTNIIEGPLIDLNKSVSLSSEISSETNRKIITEIGVDSTTPTRPLEKPLAQNCKSTIVTKMNENQCNVSKVYSAERMDDPFKETTTSKTTSLTDVAKTYFSPVCNVQCSQDNNAETPQIFSEDVENNLVDNINVVANWGFPIDLYDVQLLAKSYLDSKNIINPDLKSNMPGQDWARQFVNRQNKSICRDFYTNVSRKSFVLSPHQIIDSFFSNDNKTTLLNIDPKLLISYYEINLTGNPDATNFILRKTSKFSEQESLSKSAASIMYAGTASGHLFQPYVVYKLVFTQNLLISWRSGGPPGCFYNHSKSGWFEMTTFEDWFMKVIVPYCKEKEGKKLILGDYNSTYFSSAILAACREHNIHFSCFPSNSVDVIHPLNFAFYAPLQEYWKEVLTKWKVHRGKKCCLLFNDEVPTLLKMLHSKLEGFDGAKSKIVDGFLKTGVYPVSHDNLYPVYPDSQYPVYPGNLKKSDQVISSRKRVSEEDPIHVHKGNPSTSVVSKINKNNSNQTEDFQESKQQKRLKKTSKDDLVDPKASTDFGESRITDEQITYENIKQLMLADRSSVKIIPFICKVRSKESENAIKPRKPSTELSHSVWEKYPIQNDKGRVSTSQVIKINLNNSNKKQQTTKVFQDPVQQNNSSELVDLTEDYLGNSQITNKNVNELMSVDKSSLKIAPSSRPKVISQESEKSIKPRKTSTELGPSLWEKHPIKSYRGFVSTSQVTKLNINNSNKKQQATEDFQDPVQRKSLQKISKNDSFDQNDTNELVDLTEDCLGNSQSTNKHINDSVSAADKSSLRVGDWVLVNHGISKEVYVGQIIQVIVPNNLYLVYFCCRFMGSYRKFFKPIQEIANIYRISWSAIIKKVERPSLVDNGGQKLFLFNDDFSMYNIP